MTEPDVSSPPSERPRYSQVAFPPYAHSPGATPHPLSDPRGHRCVYLTDATEPLDPHSWQTCAAWRIAIDLFNHGYYWEAHEAWETLWQAAGRRGPLADVLKGLVKLAAAGVKVREGNPRGVRRHADRAAELLAAAVTHWDGRCAGLELRHAQGIAESLAVDAERMACSTEPHRLLPYLLELDVNA